MEGFINWFTEGSVLFKSFLQFITVFISVLLSILAVKKPVGKWIEMIAEKQDKKRVKEIMDEIDKLIEQQKKIIERLDKQEEDDLLMEGYSILRACKEALQKGEVGELEYKQLCDMYDVYTSNDGNGAVEKIWKQFKKEVKVK